MLVKSGRLLLLLLLLLVEEAPARVLGKQSLRFYYIFLSFKLTVFDRFNYVGARFVGIQTLAIFMVFYLFAVGHPKGCV